LLEEDSDILLRAVDMYRGQLHGIHRALACEEAGVVLGRAGRLEEAVQLLDAALETYETLDARLDLARASAALRSFGGRRGRRGHTPRPAFGWKALTRTEVEVARLAGQGLTNPEIGRQLFVSRRTVETHLAHVFPKLGVCSRVELAAVIARRTHIERTPTETRFL
jgi:DNA-binding NarL/FixJ family response regulator